MIKKTWIGILTFIMLLACFSGMVTASEDEIRVYMNDEQVAFDQIPTIQNGSTLVPMRAFFTALGATVEWDSSTRSVTSTRGNIEVQLTIDSDVAYRNDQELSLSTPAQIIDNHTYIPLRFVGNALGDDVRWEAATRSVFLTSEYQGVTDQIRSNEEMEVHYIDVDQGDATLITGPDFTLLIDAGRHDRNDVVPYLKSIGVEEIDVLILTHPHADHIGEADAVLTTFDVDEVWASGNDTYIENV